MVERLQEIQLMSSMLGVERKVRIRKGVVLQMKIDLHVHSSEVSMCGKMSAKETVERYKAAGYDGIVLTNHYNRDTSSHFERHGFSDFNQVYEDAYQLAKSEGEKVGLLVLFGFELRFDDCNNDYLVYGMPKEVYSDYKKLFTLRAGEFSKIAQEKGFLFYQAHPFRNEMSIRRPDCFFGIEVKNGNPRHDSRNDVAQFWAEKFGLHKIAGSDCHEPEDVGITGIETDQKVENLDDLLEVLKKDRYTIL